MSLLKTNVKKQTHLIRDLHVIWLRHGEKHGGNESRVGERDLFR